MSSGRGSVGEGVGTAAGRSGVGSTERWSLGLRVVGRGVVGRGVLFDTLGAGVISVGTVVGIVVGIGVGERDSMQIPCGNKHRGE